MSEIPTFECFFCGSPAAMLGSWDLERGHHLLTPKYFYWSTTFNQWVMLCDLCDSIRILHSREKDWFRMLTCKIDDPNAVTKLGVALSNAQDGDEIVVRTNALAELAERGAKRLGKTITVVISND